MAGKAIVTGGASGIGYAIAQTLVAGGGSVVLLDRDAGRLEEARTRLGAKGALAVDVREHAALEGAIGEAATLMDGLDQVVASAGVPLRRTILDTSPDDFAGHLAINLTGVYATLRAGAKEMIARGSGGAMVALASVAGLRGCAERVAYGAAKAGVINLVEVAALEFARHGIRVNALCPAPIETPLIAQIQNPEVRAEWLAGIPMNRYGAPEEVAEIAAFLLGEKASYITGQAIAVDGGWAATGLMSAATRKR